MKIDLWIVKLDEFPEEDGRDLSAEELDRADRFLRPQIKDRFIKRRSILRKLLSKYLSIKPNEIVIKQTKLGKPYVVNFGNQIYFNISHSQEYVLYGFSREAEIGVDIEFIDPKIEAELISNHFFSPGEIETISNASPENRAEVFFRHWTIKEAYIKLVGKGLTYPLDQVLVKDVMNQPSLEIPINPKIEKVPEHSCIYSSIVTNFGIGVVVVGESLELEYKAYGAL